MKRTKLSFIHFVIICVFLAGLLISFPYLNYWRITRKQPQVWYPGFMVFQRKTGCKAYALEKNRVDGVITFSDGGEVLRSWGITPICIDNMEDLLGMPLEELIAKYGPPHTDVGSGFWIPAYVSDDAHLIVIHESDGIVYRVVMENLMTGTIVENHMLTIEK